MGKLEERTRIRTRNGKITRAIITTLAVAVAGTLNPQGLVRGVLRSLNTPAHKQQASASAIYGARKRLARRGFIAYRENVWRITGKGKQEFRFMLASMESPRKRRWDKKWRMLIFDIREERKNIREKVRRTLISLGFYRLQDSVWVYPYDCEDLVVLLKADFKIGKDLLYIISDEIENDEFLRKAFHLG
ncbi:MAG TPA: CRISPR-associated endonuclease Cas2 [Candidatus Paceibacterota bacterium]